MRISALAFPGCVGALLFSVGWLGGCLSPPPPSERATDAARDLNIAARFGRMDIALELTSAKVRGEFIKRRAAWGNELRIVDVELAGLSMTDSDHALVQVDYAWVRMDENTLRSTRVAQNWHSTLGPWQLDREERVAGDVGLFGETVELLRPPQRDVQFPTRVIR